MRYKSITIENYKAISKPITIDFTKNSLIPIIGVNECGKTTILNAVFAFDCFNDQYDKTIKQLTDTANLYETKSRVPKISAVIDVNQSRIEKALKEIRGSRSRIKIAGYHELIIERRIDGVHNYYSATGLDFKFRNKEEENSFCKNIVSHLPYILYFDDFKDSFPERILIDQSDASQWLDIVKELFKKADKEFSVFDLASTEERKRKSTLSKVQKFLNNTLTQQWSNFKLDRKDALQISIEFQNDGGKDYLKFEVIEKDENGNEHYFYVRDRSKGFYWFFNFVMKLEFNPKVNGSENNAIYLLDEPGSYLHPFAQQKLCKKLKELSSHHKVIYCTHTHYLLDPNVIPLNTIRIADKSSSGNVTLVLCTEFPATKRKSITAFQPLYDALQLQPLPLELKNGKTLLVEGIYDFYCFSLFKPSNLKELNIIPCKGADSIVDFISLMIGFNLDYRALWDHDSEGIAKKKAAIGFFGQEEADKRFYNLPVSSIKEKKITQSLIDGKDIIILKNLLSLPADSKYTKIVAAVFFSKQKDKILSQISHKTLANFKAVFDMLKLED